MRTADAAATLGGMIRFRALAASILILLATTALAQNPPPGTPIDEEMVRAATDMFTMNDKARAEAIEKVAARNKPEIAAPLIELMPFFPQDADRIAEILRQVTGADIKTAWFEWMLWQEANPQFKPFAGYDTVKARFLGQIDLEFLRFVYPGVATEIRLEEIAWGGVSVDGIPALVDPKFTPAAEGSWLHDNELVFGVSINGDNRAYPQRIMDWHEMANDTVGGVRVALAYCTLCGAAILFETLPEGRAFPFEFGSSGLLYRSNKLMYDRQSDSLWNQFTGRPVVGKLVGSGIELKVRPVVVTRWQTWREMHPDTKVLSLDTGHKRDYSPGKPYGDYFNRPAMMFPANVTDWRLQPKDYVFAVRLPEGHKAWPIKSFAGGKVVNDEVGDVEVVLVGDATSETVRAYRRDRRSFSAGATPNEIVAEGKTWKLTEDALVGPGGETLPRLPGHNAFWFAWQNYYSGEAILGKP
ncbi:MAG: DUF3179 domain-containing protein [Reyranellaceae bacterium]